MATVAPGGAARAVGAPIGGAGWRARWRRSTIASVSAAEEGIGGLDETALRIGLAWRELRRGASMQGFVRFLAGDGPDALDLGQLDALEVVVHLGRVRMAPLAEALRVDPSTATRAVDRLVRSGLAERLADPDDARAVVVVPTEVGRSVCADASVRRREAVAAIIDSFDDREQVQLADLLERLVREVDRFVSAQAHSAGTPRAGGPASQTP